MNYYILERDRRLGSLEGKFAYSDGLQQGFSYANPYEVIHVKGEGKRDYGCLLNYPLLLVSEELRQIFMRFDPALCCKTVAIFDEKIQGQIQYYMLNLVEVTGEVDPTAKTRNNSLITYTVRDEIKTKCIFQLKVYHTSYLVLGLDIAEAVLRHSLYGVNVQKICLEERE